MSEGRTSGGESMTQVLCSTGALIGRPNGRNYKLLEEFSPQLHCDGFEFMMYDTWYDTIDELVSNLKSMHLNFPVMHCEKRIGESISKYGEGEFQRAIKLFRENCEIAKEIGATKLVLHLWDGITSDQAFYNNLNAYPRLQEIAESHSLDLLVENVVCNKENPLKHWHQLAMKYPKVHFVFDTKMAAFHNQMDAIYEEENQWLFQGNHVKHYHVNDYAGGYLDWENLKTLPIGKGKIDFERFFTLIRKLHYEDTFTVEATAFDQTGHVDIGLLNSCFDYIRAHMNLLPRM